MGIQKESRRNPEGTTPGDQTDTPGHQTGTPDQATRTPEQDTVTPDRNTGTSAEPLIWRGQGLFPHAIRDSYLKLLGKYERYVNHEHHGNDAVFESYENYENHEGCANYEDKEN